MTYLLQTPECHITVSGDTKTVDVQMKVSKGVKFVAFKLSAPDAEMKYIIKSYAPPVWAKECVITKTEYTQKKDSETVYREFIVTLTVNETSALYNATADITVFAGSFTISNWNVGSTKLVISAVDVLFAGQINKYAIVNTDSTGAHSYDVTCLYGNYSYGAATALTITNITANKSVVVPNEEITYTAVFTGTQATFTWIFTGEVIYVTDPTASSVTVKYLMPGNMTVVCQAYNSVSSVFLPKQNLTTVNAPTVVGSNESVTITPTDAQIATLGDLYAPETMTFTATYTGIPTETIFRVTSDTEIPNYLFVRNTKQIQYTFTKGQIYKVIFSAKYSETVTKTATVTLNYKYVAPTIENIVISTTSGGIPADIYWDAANVTNLANILKYVWEVAKDGNFNTGAPPLPSSEVPDPLGHGPYAPTVYPFYDRGNSEDPHYQGMPTLGTIAGPLVDNGNPQAIDAPGLYSVKLHCWTVDNSYSTHIYNIPIAYKSGGVPVPDFTYTPPNTGNAPFSITVDCGTIANSEYEVWDWGDRTTTTNTNRENTAVSHIYTKAGVYSIKLTCYNATTAPTGVSITKSAIVVVTDAAVPMPRATVTSPAFSTSLSCYPSVTTPHVVTLNLSASLNCDTIKVYNQNNDLLATLSAPFTTTNITITNNTLFHLVGTKGTLSEVYTLPYYVNIYTLPTATVGVVGKTEPIEINVGDTINFTATPSGTITSYLWSFGDGATSTLQNPSHQYLQDGVYTVTLTLTNPAGTQLITKSNYISVGSGTAFDVDFTADKTVITTQTPNETVTFTLHGTMLPSYSYLLNFGDSSSVAMSGSTATHTYTKYGDFSVTLTIIDNATYASRIITKDKFIIIKSNNAPVADFEVQQGVTTVDGKCTVNFIMRCTGSTPKYYLIDFGDGSGFVRYEADVPPGGWEPITPSKPLLPFPGCTNLPTDPDGDGLFEDLNGNGRLDFADLTLFYNNMEWVTANQPIELFDFNKNGRIDFADHVWLFNQIGKNTTRIDNSTIIHTYQNVGKYTVTLKAYNDYGYTTCTKVDCVVITLGGDGGLPNPLINVVPSHDPSTPLSGPIPLTIQFLYEDIPVGSETVTSWKWDFGNGDTSIMKNPKYTYVFPGTYYVTLKVGTSRGLEYFSDVHLVVEAKAKIDSGVQNVIPDFAAAYTTGDAPFKVKFFSTSSGSPTSFAWLFGDEPANTPFPTLDPDKGVVEHTYTTSGIYTVKMKAANELGDAICIKSRYIIVSEPSIQLTSASLCPINTIGDIFIQTINNIDSTGTNEIKRVDNKNTLDSYVYSIPSIIETMNVSGTLYDMDKTEDEYAEDIESVRFRSGAYNYISVAGKRGFLEVETVSIPKDADSAGMREYTLDCNFMSAALFERAYTLETSLYNSVINGVKYTVDHPPTVALPVNAYNVKIKSPWQTVAMKEPTYVMTSSEGKIPIYMPFKLYTSEDPSLKMYGPDADNITVSKTLEQYGYGKIILPPMEGGTSYGVTWSVRVGIDVPLGKYKVAMKVGVRSANNSVPQNVPEGASFDCVGYNLSSSMTRVASTPAIQKMVVTRDDIYYSEELDFTNYNELMELHISNPRNDTNLEIQYIYLVPTYHARVAFDAPTEYYAGETKIYDFYNGVAQRVYNVNHEFRGVMYISNPFMRWIINPKQMWHRSSDITHTRYTRLLKGQVREYGIDDPNNVSMKLYPWAFNDTYPNIAVKKILPNLIELEIVCENGVEAANATDSRMVTLVHVTPYAFKFYVQPIGDFRFHWCLESTNDDSSFQYSYGNLMCKYGDDADSYAHDGMWSNATIPSIMTNHGNYLYMLSFYDYMDTYFAYTGANITFPYGNRKGNYQFTLNVLPMIMDNNYDYSDDLVCFNDSMQLKYNSSISDREIDITADVGDDREKFFNLFEVTEGYAEDVALSTDRFAVSHTNQYAKNKTTTALKIQNKEFSHFKMDFDLSMTTPEYMPELMVKYFESTNKDTYYYVLIRARSTDNVTFGIICPGFGSYDARYTKTVNLNLLTGGTDHVTIVEEQYQGQEGFYKSIVKINGETVLTVNNDLFINMISPIELKYSMLYSSSVTLKNLKIRPYLTTEQTFANGEKDKRYFKFGDVTAPSYMDTTALMLNNSGGALLKSYKMLSGMYTFDIAKPNSGASTLTIYLNADLVNTPYNSLYIEIPSGGGTMYLKRSYEDGTVEVLGSTSVGAMTNDTKYTVNVELDDVTHAVNIWHNNASISVTIPVVHFKYGYVGFKASPYSVAILKYGLCGTEKFGRGPQVCKYMDDFDYGPDTGTLLAKEYNSGYESHFTHNLTNGTLIDHQEGSTNAFKVLYPNTVNPMYGKVRAVIKSTRTTSTLKKAGVITNVTKISGAGQPIGGYGAFLNFKTGAVEVVMFDYPETAIGTPTTIFSQSISAFTLMDDRLYEMTVERVNGAIYITVANFEGYSQSFIVPLGLVGMNSYDNNGIYGLSTWCSSTDYGIQFDDFTIENIVYKNTQIAYTTIGGISHGGEYDVEMAIYDKVSPGVTIPYGYYYLVANAHSTANDTNIFFGVKNFEDNTPIIEAAYDGGNTTDLLIMETVNQMPDQFARYIIKLGEENYDDECGIEVKSNVIGSAYTNHEYIPVIFVNYIIMIPLSGTMGKQIFLHELEMINRSPTVVYRRLEKKKIS